MSLTCTKMRSKMIQTRSRWALATLIGQINSKTNSFLITRANSTSHLNWRTNAVPSPNSSLKTLTIGIALTRTITNVIGTLRRTSNWLNLSKSMVLKIGKRSPASWIKELTCSASTAGRRSWIPLWLRDRGLRRRMPNWLRMWKSTEQRTGVTSLRHYLVGLANSVGRGGIITWILTSRRINGRLTKIEGLLRLTKSMAINGRRSLSSFLAVLIIISRIDSTPLSKGGYRMILSRKVRLKYRSRTARVQSKWLSLSQSPREKTQKRSRGLDSFTTSTSKTVG